MDALTLRVSVLTVGLTSQTRSQLDSQLAQYPEIDLQHLGGWTFRLLEADVVVLNLEQHDGQEVRDMLRSFQGAKAPLQVTYSESEARMRMWRDVHPISGRVTGHESEPPFSRRLQDALRKAGCYQVVIDELHAEQRVIAGDEETPAAFGGIRWTG